MSQYVENGARFCFFRCDHTECFVCLPSWPKFLCIPSLLPRKLMLEAGSKYFCLKARRAKRQKSRKHNKSDLFLPPPIPTSNARAWKRNDLARFCQTAKVRKNGPNFTPRLQIMTSFPPLVITMDGRVCQQSAALIRPLFTNDLPPFQKFQMITSAWFLVISCQTWMLAITIGLRESTYDFDQNFQLQISQIITMTTSWPYRKKAVLQFIHGYWQLSLYIWLWVGSHLCFN